METMKADVSLLLMILAERAKVHQEQLQIQLRCGHDQIGRALGNTDSSWAGNDERDAVDWAMKALESKARLDEVQLIIAKLTRACGAAAASGKSEVS
jgi:hypothetical protein